MWFNTINYKKQDFVILLGLVLLLLTFGCSSRENIGLNVYFVQSSQPTEAPSPFPAESTNTPEFLPTITPVDVTNNLIVVTHVLCSCMNDRIVASVQIKPLNGIPPYKIPQYDFDQIQFFDNLNLGDVLRITVQSSDQPIPLTWIGEIPIQCDPIPVCKVAPETQKPNNEHNNSSSSQSSSSSSSSQSSSSSSSSQSSSSSSSSQSSSSSSSSQSSSSSATGGPPGIPECPNPGKGGTPPGICKKK